MADWKVGGMIAALVSILIMVIIVAALFPTFLDGVTDSQNTTNDTVFPGVDALLGIIPLLFIVALVVGLVTWAIGRRG